MAIKLTKKDSKVQEAPAVQAPAASPIGYLPEDVQAEVAKLAPEVQAKFSQFSELTTAVLDAVMEDIPETLTERLLEIMEGNVNEQLPDATPAPAQEVTAQEAPVTDAAARKAQRDALKNEILANSTQATKPATKVEAPSLDGKPETVKTVTATQPASTSFNAWDNLFPVNQAVTVINRGGGKFEVHFGSVAPTAQLVADKAEAPAKKPKKPSVKTIFDDIQTKAYREYIVTLKEKYPTLQDRVAWAESLGLVRGKDWVNVTKAGEPMPASVENMYISDAIRTKLGIETYVEGARTKEQRKKIANGELPLPPRDE